MTTTKGPTKKKTTTTKRRSPNEIRLRHDEMGLTKNELRDVALYSTAGLVSDIVTRDEMLKRANILGLPMSVFTRACDAASEEWMGSGSVAAKARRAASGFFAVVDSYCERVKRALCVETKEGTVRVFRQVGGGKARWREHDVLPERKRPGKRTTVENIAARGEVRLLSTDMGLTAKELRAADAEVRAGATYRNALRMVRSLGSKLGDTGRRLTAQAKAMGVSTQAHSAACEAAIKAYNESKKGSRCIAAALAFRESLMEYGKSHGITVTVVPWLAPESDASAAVMREKYGVPEVVSRRGGEAWTGDVSAKAYDGIIDRMPRVKHEAPEAFKVGDALRDGFYQSSSFKEATDEARKRTKWVQPGDRVVDELGLTAEERAVLFGIPTEKMILFLGQRITATGAFSTMMMGAMASFLGGTDPVRNMQIARGETPTIPASAVGPEAKLDDVSESGIEEARAAAIYQFTGDKPLRKGPWGTKMRRAGVDERTIIVAMHAAQRAWADAPADWTEVDKLGVAAQAKDRVLREAGHLNVRVVGEAKDLS